MIPLKLFRALVLGLLLTGCATTYKDFKTTDAINGSNFQIGEGDTYFGQIDFDWANERGVKARDMLSAIDGDISESNNDGTIKIPIKDDNMAEVVKAYEQQTKQEKMAATNSLTKVGQ